MKKILSLCLILLTLFVLSACSKQPKYENSKKVKFTFLAEPYAPLTYLKNGKPTGMAVDVIQAIAEEIGIGANVKIQSWDKSYSEAVKNPNTILLTAVRLPERESLFYWLEPPVMTFSDYFFKKRGSDIKINHIIDAKKYKLGVTKGYYNLRVLQRAGFKNLVINSTPERTMRALLDGEVDLVCCADFRAEILMKKLGHSISSVLPVCKFDQRESYIVISKKTSEDLAKEWQQAFDRIRKNKTYYKIYKKWFMSHTLGH